MCFDGKTILVIAAHPDDEVLGCGGTTSRLVNEGSVVHTLILGEGITSRDEERNRSGGGSKIVDLQKEAERANSKLGVKKVYFGDFPDNRFDSCALLDIVKKIEHIKHKVKPDIIFTHYGGDCNIDHRVTYEAVITATRPMQNETVKEIYSFEVLSSTEWRFPLSYSPNVFFDVTETIEQKIKALDEYKTEMREYPHPRSTKAVKKNAETWGFKMGLKYAEAFQCIRCQR